MDDVIHVSLLQRFIHGYFHLFLPDIVEVEVGISFGPQLNLIVGCETKVSKNMEIPLVNV